MGFTNTLNNYWLWSEIRSKLNLSNPAYKFWSMSQNIKLNNKYVFIQKHSLPKKYIHVEHILTDLSGYLPIRYASDQLHVNEHVFTYEKMKLYREFEYKFVADIKFVNIKKFFMEFGISVKKNSLLHLGHVRDLEITANSTFYHLRDDYGLVIYD